MKRVYDQNKNKYLPMESALFKVKTKDIFILTLTSFSELKTSSVILHLQ